MPFDLLAQSLDYGSSNKAVKFFFPPRSYSLVGHPSPCLKMGVSPGCISQSTAWDKVSQERTLEKR